MSRIVDAENNTVGTWKSDPIFFGGQWFYDKRFASKVLLGDTVSFVVSTNNIAAGETVNVDIYRDIDWGLDKKLQSISTTVNAKSYCSFDLYIKPEWLSEIEDGNKQWMELYCKLDYKGTTQEEPTDSNKFLKVYSIGYLPESESRIKVLSNGEVEFWPEHFGFLARGEWNQLNFPYRDGSKVYIDESGQAHIGGVPKTISQIIISNANNNIAERDLPEIEQTKRQELQQTRSNKRFENSETGRNAARPPIGSRVAAGATLVLDAALMAYDIAAPYAVNSELNKIKAHQNILINEISKDLQEALTRHLIDDKFIMVENISRILAVLLYGGTNNHHDAVFQIGKSIYREVSNFKKVE